MYSQSIFIVWDFCILGYKKPHHYPISRTVSQVMVKHQKTFTVHMKVLDRLINELGIR